MITLYVQETSHKSKIHRTATYTVDGDPIALARPRFARNTMNVWDPQKQIKLVWQISLQNQHEGPLFIGPLLLDVTFYLSMPKRLSTKKHDELKLAYHTCRPDLDNMLKFVADVATKVCYNEDSLIAAVCAKKVYDDNPRTQFTITEL